MARGLQRVRRQRLVGVTEDRELDVERLGRGLDGQIDVGEAPQAFRGLDSVEEGLTVGCRELALVDLLGEDRAYLLLTFFGLSA